MPEYVSLATFFFIYTEVKIMTFDAWLEKEHGISLKTFELRHSTVQKQMIEEYNINAHKT